MFKIPIFGTMAHAYVQAHDSERAAFETFARAHPGNVVLLIDTYDTEQGARVVVGSRSASAAERDRNQGSPPGQRGPCGTCLEGSQDSG